MSAAQQDHPLEILALGSAPGFGLPVLRVGDEELGGGAGGKRYRPACSVPSQRDTAQQNQMQNNSFGQR